MNIAKNTKKQKKQFPIKNAFTFAQELARKHKWPSFVFEGKQYSPYATLLED